MSGVSRRRLEALRALAERPGTEAEGLLAREKLARAEKEYSARGPYEHFADYLRSGSMDDLSDALGDINCECGAKRRHFTACTNTTRHEQIRREAEARFPKGTRAYYNKWAYSRNCPCTVLNPSSGDWNWVRVKFDHLKTARNIPIYTKHGWHLSTEPIDDASDLRDGMENLEAAAAEESRQRWGAATERRGGE